MSSFDTRTKENLTQGVFTRPGVYACVVKEFSWHLSTKNLAGIDILFECVHRPLRATKRKVYMLEGAGTPFTSALLEAHGCHQIKETDDAEEWTKIFANRIVLVHLRNGKGRPGGGFYLDIAGVSPGVPEAERLSRAAGYWDGVKPQSSMLVSSRQDATQENLSGDGYTNRYGQEDEIPI